MMASLVSTLGIAGVAGVFGMVAAIIYTVSLMARTGATWFSDLERVRHWHTSRPRRQRFYQRPVPGNLWPVMGPTLPRGWRWPLNSTRWFSARLWHLIAYRRGLFGLIARAAWFPSAGIGAAAALVWAMAATLTVSVPIAVGWWLIDSTTVLRGGTPPRGTPTPSTTPPLSSGGDWDRALVELLDDRPSEVEHGIRLGPDGQALDPADQYALDCRRHANEARAADDRLARIERILDREERLADRNDRRNS